jgi:hypothetical protein
MSKKRVDETAVSPPDETAITETKETPGQQAAEHLAAAVKLLRSAGGEKSQPYGYIATKLDHWRRHIERREAET